MLNGVGTDENPMETTENFVVKGCKRLWKAISFNRNVRRRQNNGETVVQSEYDILEERQHAEILAQNAVVETQQMLSAGRLDPLQVLPLEISQYLMSFLSLTDILNAHQVSLTWKDVAESDTVWRQIVVQNHFSISVESDALSVKQKLQQESETISHYYSHQLIDALGGKNKMMTFPVLYLQSYSEYLSIKLSDMKGAEIKRGVDAAKRPFVSLCVEDHSSNDEDKKYQVQTLFQRYTSHPKIWLAAGDPIVPFVKPQLSERSFEFLKRLTQHQPCGRSVLDQEQKKTLTNGQSMVELSDQITIRKLNI